MKVAESNYFQFGLATLSPVLELDICVSAFSQTHIRRFVIFPNSLLRIFYKIWFQWCPIPKGNFNALLPPKAKSLLFFPSTSCVDSICVCAFMFM